MRVIPETHKKVLTNTSNRDRIPERLITAARRVVLGYGDPVDAKSLTQTPLPIDVPVIPRHRGRPRTAPAATGRQRGRPRKRG